MKKYLFSILVFLIFQSASFSQRVYIKGLGGFSMAASPQEYTRSENIYFNEQGITNRDYKTEIGSYGAGVRSSLSLGTMVTENFGFEIEASYLKGKVLQSYYNMFVERQNLSDKYKTYSSSKFFTLAPSILITSKGHIINPYAKAGLIIGRPEIIRETKRVLNDKSNNTSIDQNYYYKFQIAGKTAVGMQGGIGTNIYISDRLSLVNEITFASLSFTPAEGKRIAYEVDGENLMNEGTEFERTTKFVDSYSPYEADSFKPRKELNSPLPFNYVGIQIGIQLNILKN